MTVSLILGGARSGKTTFAQQEAIASKLPVRLIVTAQILDQEMAERVEKHKQSRPAEWDVIEAPLDLPEQLLKTCNENVIVIVDCLTLWLSNCFCQQSWTLDLMQEKLLDAVRQTRGKLFLVSNEVGWGIVPENPLARLFRDEAGRLNQQLAKVADEVKLIVAGYPVTLK